MKKKVLKYSVIALIAVLGIAAIRDEGDKYFEIAKNLEIFANLYKDLNTYYVDDLDPNKLMKTGIDAMVGSLDPYTNYITENQIESYRYMTEGKYNGIGAVVRKVDDYPTVIEPYEGFAADKAGLKAGDIILSINGKSAKGKDNDEVTAIMRGVPGTDIEMSVLKPGQKDPIIVKLIRSEVSMKNVPYWGMVSPKVGYIVLTTFTQDAGEHVADAYNDLKSKNPLMESVILDLRENGGGLLNEAVNICNVFIPKNELVVSTKGKVREWDKSYKTLNNSIDEKVRLAVLVNKHSASASEIVSGVIQDLDRGLLIGQRSYGKGLVQNTRDVGYNSRVKLTTSKYYIPSGRCIQSVQYIDGEPKDIADSLRNTYRTRSGRKVLDGGGVTPDIRIVKMASPSIVKGLNEKSVIFKYATEYYQAHPSIVAAADFKFLDYDDFVRFAEKSKFTYETESEKLLKTLQEKSTEDQFSKEVATEIETLQAKIRLEKKDDMQQYKSEIIKEIEEEIVSRYYYQKGKIQYDLKNDNEILTAIQYLEDPSKYEKALK
ncbi:MAG: S41 family peptidase [Saprospiraceae bacterium]